MKKARETKKTAPAMVIWYRDTGTVGPVEFQIVEQRTQVNGSNGNVVELAALPSGMRIRSCTNPQINWGCDPDSAGGVTFWTRGRTGAADFKILSLVRNHWTTFKKALEKEWSVSFIQVNDLATDAADYQKRKDFAVAEVSTKKPAVIGVPFKAPKAEAVPNAALANSYNGLKTQLTNYTVALNLALANIASGKTTAAKARADIVIVKKAMKALVAIR